MSQQELAGPNVEVLTSLRRRGLMSAHAFQLQVAALAPEAPGRRSLWLQPFAVIVTVLGCIIAIPGVVFQELQAGGFGPIFAAPIIEEAMKPAGIYILMLRWPKALLGRAHTAFLAGVAGLTFGLIESLVYVTLYFPDEGSDFVLFRFTVPLLMHVTASTIVGWGLSRTVIDWAAGRAAFPKTTRNFYFAG
ncbi:MAG TPA: PrsW family glutamic-type intramembrane protease, partial [Dehalococcoidia bacterium]|nr:PrsW family glutamic-type intramembrane protease [Dehalococcoidia bacterium]